MYLLHSLARDRDGRSRGFGTVRFASVDEAQRALELHTKEPFVLGGRTLFLNYSRPKPELKEHNRVAPPSERVYYQGTFATEQELRSAFGEHEKEIVEWTTRACALVDLCYPANLTLF
jgi:RNA recognition motif-containing protein